MRLLKLRLSKLRTAVISVAVLALIATTAVVAVAQGETSDWQAVRGEAITRIASDYMGAERDQVADNIANDVTSRGTVWRFMLGSDSGVLYGVGPSAVQPEIQVRTRTTTTTQTVTRTTPPEIRLFLPTATTPNETYVVGSGPIVPITLPVATPADTGADPEPPVTYTLSGAPSGWSYSPPSNGNGGMLSGAPTVLGTHHVAWQATQDGKSDILSFTITIMRDEKPTLASGPGNKEFAIGDMVNFALPKATDKNAPMGTVTYHVSNLPATLMFETTTGVISGEVTSTDVPRVYTVSFTATVVAADNGDAGTNHTVTSTFDIRIVAAVPNGS